MRHLVTGGAGFIGSHLCEKLLDLGHEVICLDNMFTGRVRNIAGLTGRPGFEFVRHDVCDPFHFEVDRVWSLACPASPVHYQRNAVRTVKTSVLGTLHALELAREVGARALITSTSEVYGEPAVHPQPESYRGDVNPVGPRACYDEGKRCAETIATAFSRQYGVEVRIARLFNCYGDRMAPDDGRVVSNFVTQALEGRPLTVYGDGSQTRSFIFVDDMVEALMLLMDAETVDRSVSPPRYCFPVNLGNPAEFTVLQLGNLVQEMVGQVGYEHRPALVDDPTRRCPDISVARELLGWAPRTELREGLRRTVAYFRTGSR